MSFIIDGFEIDSVNNNVYVIAEVGNNHNGDFELAKKLIRDAKEVGANCVKFQMRQLNKVYRSKSLEKLGDDLGAEYTIDLLKRFELSIDHHRELKKYCDEIKITYLCTPWDEESLNILEQMKVSAYKVASADFTNLPLIQKLIETGKPIILSTGMTTEEEIKEVVSFLNQKNANFALLHCNSTYPAPFHSINLKYLNELKKIHQLIGYSGHERGITTSLGAVALGAKIVERHFTEDRNMEGPDHAASLEKSQFSMLVEGIRELEESLGRDGKKQVSQGEMINRENLAKSLVAKRDLSKGDIITKDDIDIKSPGQGISPLYFEKLIGKKLKRDLEKEDFFFKSDLAEKNMEFKEYKFKHPWGIPIRYHDMDYFLQLCRPDLVEFHLSYSDMDLKLEDYFKQTFDIDFVVHAPELFEGSHLMDLATLDDEYRNNSIRETQRVIDITRGLKKYFPKTERPMIVANVGGFTRDEKLSPEMVRKYYDRFSESLKELDLEGVELIPQTMAPFPWHFGGQRYQNLFVHADEIVEECKRNNLRMCFDISHSKLTCNHFGHDFKEFVKKVAPYTAHLHLGDAKGVDGEGLQVGDGEINFNEIGSILNDLAPTATFIPEIWQGHKNQGEGFWVALNKLENIL